jgi:hypothetical protein
LRVNGKLIVRSLKTTGIAVAKLRLSDLEKHERKIAECSHAPVNGNILFFDALNTYYANGFRPSAARNRKEAKDSAGR